MLEKEMEDLIAENPDLFFPRQKLTLTGRQGTFSSIGRYDLLFKDEFDYNILMELKAVPAKYKDAHQLAKYKDALYDQGESKIQLWLVAPNIPKSVRDFLDDVGIEYSEIHEAEFKKIASKVGYKFKSEEPATSSTIIDTASKDKEYSSSKPKSGKYYSNKDKLKSFFPAAYNFLDTIESHQIPGFTIGKAVNVHLYYQDGFYAYIKLYPSTLTFSPFPNQRIKGDKKNKAKLLFDKPFVDLVESLKGFNKWAFRNGNEFEIKNTVPEEFFSKLVLLIADLHK